VMLESQIKVALIVVFGVIVFMLFVLFIFGVVVNCLTNIC
jgi:hypothetical protein